jgi:MraZ protein
MAEERENDACIYNSLYRHEVDTKRRVQVPSKWRSDKGGTQFTLIVWPKHKEGVCLRVLPPLEMAKLMADLDKLPVNERVTAKRQIGARSEQVTVDSAGRVCIPQEMAEAADIKDKVVMVGLLDKFELWSPDRYSAVEAADQILSARAFDLME